MSHVALITLPFHGHVNPTLGVVAELVARGHRVSYAATEEFADAVTAAGATVVPYRNVAGSSLDVTVKTPEELTPDEFHETILGVTAEGLSPLEPVHTALDGDRPDVLLHDITGFHAGRLLAMQWGRPAIQLCTTLVFNDKYNPYLRFMELYPPIDPAHPHLVEERELMVDSLAAHGAGGMDPETFKADTSTVESSLVFIPRQLQPEAEHFGPEWAFVGPCIADRSHQGRFRLAKPRRTGAPLLAIGFGSFGYGNQHRFFADCIRAFTGSRWHVVLVVGRQVDLDALGPLPDNIEAHRWVAQLELLDQADLFVSHAGMGSVIEALYTGTPVVLLPQLTEQDLVAEQTQSLGVGRMLPRGEHTGDQVRRAVEQLARDPSVGGNVAAVRAQLIDAGGSARAADVVEDCLRRRTG